MRRRTEGMGARLLVMAMVLLAVPALLPGEAVAEDVEVSTTFLTFFKNGGGYIEYRISGRAASELRHMIDDPAIMFPFETRMADGDGLVDQNEGESYMSNMDDLLTKRQIVLRGVKMENVDVDEHRGLIGSEVNDTDELYLHITFRGGIQYDKMEFNVSGLEPLAVLYGSYDNIPDTLTVDESMFIVAAGMGAYMSVSKEEGSLYNLRAPMAAVVSYHGSYTAASPPVNRMEYDHDTMAGNPLILMIFMILITVLTIKLPKALARENSKERVRQFHLAILIVTILFWVFYALGGNAYVVLFLGIALTGSAYALAYQIYARDWRGMAHSTDGIDLGEALSAIDPVTGKMAPEGPKAQGPSILGEGGTGIDPHPSEEVVVAMPDDNVLTAVDPAMSQPAIEDSGHVITAPMAPVPELPAPPPAATPPPAAPAPVAPPPAAPQPAAPLPVEVPPPDAEPVGTKAMRCKCGGVFKVPLEPRPLEVQCPHCGTTGTLKS